MNIEKKREAFEKFHARECNCDYDELKRRLDHQEKVIGHRYIPSSPRHEAWLVWDAAWQAKAQAVPEGFVLVLREPTKEIIAHMTNTPIEVNLLCDNADIFLSEDEALIAYKAMIEAQEQNQ